MSRGLAPLTQFIFVSSRTLCRDYRLQLLDPPSTTAVKYLASSQRRRGTSHQSSAIAVKNAALGTLLARLSHKDELGHFYACTKKLGGSKPRTSATSPRSCPPPCAPQSSKRVPTIRPPQNYARRPIGLTRIRPSTYSPHIDTLSPPVRIAHACPLLPTSWSAFSPLTWQAALPLTGASEARALISALPWQYLGHPMPWLLVGDGAIPSWARAGNETSKSEKFSNSSQILTTRHRRCGICMWDDPGSTPG
ncbi:hypothetical protein C8R44DRAFT_979102 [Mycena epipterygia]|nr:hypothetical protein C8R44DRAFT_979102 [Mycena epipterygia]